MEEQPAQGGRHRTLVLQGEEEGGGQVLVHLALGFQLQLRHRAGGARAEEQVEEVAHLLGEGAEGAQVAVVEAHPRVLASETVADVICEHHAHRHRIPFCRSRVRLPPPGHSAAASAPITNSVTGASGSRA